MYCILDWHDGGHLIKVGIESNKILCFDEFAKAHAYIHKYFMRREVQFTETDFLIIQIPIEAAQYIEFELFKEPA